MPSKGSRRRNASSHSLFDRRSVVVQRDDGTGAWCPCSLSLSLDRSREICRGNLILRFFAQFEGFDASQLVTLRLPLENIRRMQHEYGNEKNIPSTIHDHFAQDNPVRTEEQVLTISFDMSAPGRVIVPLTATILAPKKDCRTAVQAFQGLCQSTNLLIYIPANDITETQKAALQKFNESAGKQGMLASMPMHLQRMYDGHGARETTWEIFDIAELPPAYPQQPERATSKRARAVSQDLTPKRRAIDFFSSARPGSAAHVSNTDTDTDFSAYAFSPLPPSVSHVGVTTASRDRTSTPTSVDVDLVHLAVRSTVQDALPNIVENALSDMLPALLESTVQGMLPKLLHDAIRGLRRGNQQDHASATSQFSAEQDKAGQYPLAAIIEPIIEEQLPTVVRKVIDEDGTYDDLVYEAQQQIELVISEEKDDALDQIREERDICVRDVQETGTIIREMLEHTDPSVDGDRNPQAILQAILRTVRSSVSSEGAQSDPLRFTNMRFEGEAPESAESTEDLASTTDAQRVEGSPSTHAGSCPAFDGTTAAEVDVESEDGQVEGDLSSSISNPSPSARLLGKSPYSKASTAGAQVQTRERGQSSSGSMDGRRNLMGAEIRESAGGRKSCKECQYPDLSPTQADTEIDVAGKGEVEMHNKGLGSEANLYGRRSSASG